MLDETDREARITLIERATVVLYFLVALTGFSLLAAFDIRFLLGALFTYVGLALLDVWWGTKKPVHHSRHLRLPRWVRVVEATYVTLVVIPCTFLLFPVFVLLFTGPVMLGGLWRKGPYWRNKLPNAFEGRKESEDEEEWQDFKVGLCILAAVTALVLLLVVVVLLARSP